MRLAVTDANIFIDLIKLDLIAHLFSIELEIYTCEDVIDELNDHQTDILRKFQQSGQLIIRHLTDDERHMVDTLKSQRGLSYADRSSIVLTKEIKGILLTGDGRVRKFCEREKIEFKGILWMFDCFLHFQCISYTLAVEKMELLMTINNRLPTDECQVRLKIWQKLIP